MPAIRVGSYRLAVLGSVEGQSSSSIATRAILIKPHDSYQGRIQSAFVLFYPQPSGNLAVTSSNTGVSARLDIKDYHDMYHLLQTESPTYFDWIDGLYFRVITDEEFPGEGYMDTSG